MKFDLNIEKLLQRKDSLDVNFRLWLTTYSTKEFPLYILENSVKITNEPPHSLRSSLLAAYTNEPISDSNFFEKIKSDPKQMDKKLNVNYLMHLSNSYK